MYAGKDTQNKKMYMHGYHLIEKNSKYIANVFLYDKGQALNWDTLKFDGKPDHTFKVSDINFADMKAFDRVFKENKIDRTGKSFATTMNANFQVVKGGEYKFILKANDGANLLIDGKPLINKWEYGEKIYTTFKSAVVQLDAGFHSITVEYMKSASDEDAVLQVTYKGPDTADKVVPVRGVAKEGDDEDIESRFKDKQLAPAKTTLGEAHDVLDLEVSKYSGDPKTPEEYASFAKTNLANKYITGVLFKDSADFQATQIPLGSTDKFYSKITGYFHATTDGVYQFAGQAKGGFKMYLGTNKVLDGWSKSGAK